MTVKKMFVHDCFTGKLYVFKYKESLGIDEVFDMFTDKMNISVTDAVYGEVSAVISDDEDDCIESLDDIG